MSYPIDDEDGHFECGREIDRLTADVKLLLTRVASLEADLVAARVEAGEWRLLCESAEQRAASIRAETIEECARIAEDQDHDPHWDTAIAERIRALAQDEPPAAPGPKEEAS